MNGEIFAPPQSDFAAFALQSLASDNSEKRQRREIALRLLASESCTARSFVMDFQQGAALQFLACKKGRV